MHRENESLHFIPIFGLYRVGGAKNLIFFKGGRKSMKNFRGFRFSDTENFNSSQPPLINTERPLREDSLFVGWGLVFLSLI